MCPGFKMVFRTLQTSVKLSESDVSTVIPTNNKPKNIVIAWSILLKPLPTFVEFFCTSGLRFGPFKRIADFILSNVSNSLTTQKEIDNLNVHTVRGIIWYKVLCA